MDTLGIGSFAPSIAFYNATHMVDDRILVPTLNAAISLPVLAEALLFISAVEVDFATLIIMAICGMVGAFVGARLQGKVNTKMINMIMGSGLIIAAFFIFAGQVGIMPTGGDAIGLYSWKLILACIVNFFIGVFVNFGIGTYAPCMCLVYLLGMSPLVAFPIMMLSACTICPVAGITYIKKGQVDRWLYAMYSVFGVIGVLIAVYVVKSMPTNVLQWLVFGVVLYAGLSVLIKAVKQHKA